MKKAIRNTDLKVVKLSHWCSLGKNNAGYRLYYEITYDKPEDIKNNLLGLQFLFVNPETNKIDFYPLYMLKTIKEIKPGDGLATLGNNTTFDVEAKQIAQIQKTVA